MEFILKRGRKTTKKSSSPHLLTGLLSIPLLRCPPLLAAPFVCCCNPPLHSIPGNLSIIPLSPDPPSICCVCCFGLTPCCLLCKIKSSRSPGSLLSSLLRCWGHGRSVVAFVRPGVTQQGRECKGGWKSDSRRFYLRWWGQWECS